MGKETWTQEQIDLAIDLWRQGVSGSVIGARMRPPKSRCAILGKLHRLKLTAARPTRVQRPNSSRAARQARHKKRLAEKAASPASPLARLMAEPFVRQPAPVIPRDELLDIQSLGDNQCRYPCTDGPPNSHLFCPREKVPGLPYCQAHSRICFLPPKERGRPSYEVGIAAHVARPRPDTDIHAVLTAFDQLEKVR